MSRPFIAVLAVVFAAFIAFFVYTERTMQPMSASAIAQEAEKQRPARALVVPVRARVATFAGGCFWGVEETFARLPGVLDTQAGYTGGTTPRPTYATMHHDKTGYVEAVEVVYDPAKIGYGTLLAAFFAHHNPTLPTRTGQAMGKQYRSFIFTHDANQASAAQAIITRLSDEKHYAGAPLPIVTQIRPAQPWWPAEAYHQRYYQKQGTAAACGL